MEKISENKWLFILTGAASGLFIGFANGFFGGGGGMICVPVLLLLGLAVKKSHATAILIMLPISIASGVIYITKGFFDFDIVLFVLIGCVAGGALGALFLKKLNPLITQFAFSLIVIAAGIRLLL